MKIGVSVASMGLPVRSALPKAARIGAKGVELEAAGDLLPDRLSDTGRRELRTLLRTYDLELTAIRCPLRFPIDTIENQDARLEHIRKAMQLAFEMGCRLVSVDCPAIPDDFESPAGKNLDHVLNMLGRFGDHIGSKLALEIGIDSGERVTSCLDRLATGCLGVTYDPTNLLLNGHDPIQNLIPLSKHLLYSHARDGRRSKIRGGGSEVVLGAGDIDWLSYIGTLTAVEYRGWLVVEREDGPNTLEDLRSGIQFLKRFVMA